jgi:hypothetical protein
MPLLRETQSYLGLTDPVSQNPALSSFEVVAHFQKSSRMDDDY